jgi:hypothetical protein
MDVPEYLADKLDDAQDIFNVLCLIYDDQSHDTFRAALERFLYEKFDCTILDTSEHNALMRDAYDLSSTKDEADRLHGD